jgi:hypothetical protein
MTVIGAAVGAGERLQQQQQFNNVCDDLELEGTRQATE